MPHRLAIFAALAAALATPALADDHRHHRDDGEVWMAERVFVYRAADGSLQQSQWRVVERSQQRCRIAVQRADQRLNRQISGGLLENKRFTPCQRVSTRSSVN